MIPADRFEGIPVFDAAQAAQPFDVRFITTQGMDEELRELITSADADTRQLIFDAVGGSPPGMKALRVLADAGHKASRMHLGRRLAREGHLDELRQRADNGDEYAQHWLDEALSQLYRRTSTSLEDR